MKIRKNNRLILLKIHYNLGSRTCKKINSRLPRGRHIKLMNDRIFLGFKITISQFNVFC